MTGEDEGRLAYRRPAELDGGGRRRPVVVVGGGPVGLTAAIDLALHGVPVVLLDEDDTVATGSRAICWAKRSLEIFDRLGCGARMVKKGVTWNLGKVFHRDQLVYSFNLQPEAGHKMPAFINLQQFYVEQYLIDRAEELPGIDLRWRNRLVGAVPGEAGVTVEVATPDGSYRLEAEWLLAADGARSTVRRLLDLPFEGEIFEDRFLIADVRMQAEFPTERRFWFDPPFHPGQSALLHKQPDDVWRIDLQLGWDADPEAERRPERVVPRIRAVLGEGVPFELEWVSIYTFQCRRLRQFRHNRILFLGDSAHQVSPFGARGGNSGIQDADNLVWKLDLVLKGHAPEALLDSYDEERGRAADENIGHSTRSTEFIAPKGAASRRLRDAVLSLAADHDFARGMVNSGRLSLPSDLAASPLQSADGEDWGPAGSAGVPPGRAMSDAPLRAPDGRVCWLLERFGGVFALLLYEPQAAERRALAAALQGHPIGARIIEIGAAASAGSGASVLVDAEGLVRERYALAPGSACLVRPDQHVAARWRRPDPGAVLAALDRAMQRPAGAGSVAAA